MKIENESASLINGFDCRVRVEHASNHYPELGAIKKSPQQKIELRHRECLSAGFGRRYGKDWCTSSYCHYQRGRKQRDTLAASPRSPFVVQVVRIDMTVMNVVRTQATPS